MRTLRLRMRDAERLFTAERVRGYAALLAVANVACAVAWLLSLRRGIDPWGNGLGSDFLTFYAAGRVALQGHAAWVFDAARLVCAERAALPASTGVLRWFYPPSFLLLITPFAVLPYGAAVAAWLAMQAAAFAVLVRQLSREAAAPLLALAFPAVLICGLQGQNGFLFAACLGLGLLLSERRPLVAGVLIGVLACKPHLALVAPLALAAGARWRVLGAAATTAASIALLSVLAFGPAPWAAFLATAPAASDALAEGRLPWTEIPSVFVLLRSLHLPASAAMLGHLAVAAPVLAATAAAWRRGGPLALRAALAAAASLLVSPYVFTYDLVILAVPLGVAAEHLRREGGPAGARLLLALLFASPLLILASATLSGVQAGCLATVVAWGLAWRLLERSRTAASAWPLAASRAGA